MQGPSATLQAQLEELIKVAVAQGMGTAAAVGVIDHEGRRLVASRGFLQPKRPCLDEPLEDEPAPPLGTDAVFDLASLTKPMVTSTLLAKLVERGDVDLNGTLAEHWPAAAGTVLGASLVADLLGHTSGAIAWLDFSALTQHLKAGERRLAVQEAVLDHPLERLPGVSAVYSDLGFMALGWMIESLTGANLDEAFSRHVAAPLGLERAHFPGGAARPHVPYVVTEVWERRCPAGAPLRGVVHDDNCAALDGVAGHAGLFADVGDVLTWAQVWLQASLGRRPSAGGPSPRVARAWTSTARAPQTTWRLGFDSPSGAASTAGPSASSSAFGHLGFTGTSVWICPERRVAVVLLTNRVYPTRDRVEHIRALRPRVHEAVWRAVDQQLPWA